MPTEQVIVSAPQPITTREVLLRRFLQAYWLRPENALWMTLRSAVLSRCPLTAPTIDVSCGDGIFSFLHAGGVFDPAFDVFGTVAHLHEVRDQHADMFNCVSEDYRPTIVSGPRTRIAVGTDVKPAQLTKAERLRLYETLVRHDNESPLPFGDEAFETVYCNSAYWVRDIAGFLRSLRRVTRSNGRIILHVKLDSLRRYTLDAFKDILGDRVLDILGRGRLETWPSLADRTTWESRFKEAGLTIESADPFVTRTHAHLWDVGLRPIAPMLVKMAAALSTDSRCAIKLEWVDLFCDLLGPLCDPQVDLFAGSDEPAEIQYVLSPS